MVAGSIPGRRDPSQIRAMWPSKRRLRLPGRRARTPGSLRGLRRWSRGRWRRPSSRIFLVEDIGALAERFAVPGAYDAYDALGECLRMDPQRIVRDDLLVLH